MPNYLCLQRTLPGADADTEADADTDSSQPSATEMQAMYARFTAWQAQFSANLVDLGGRLGDGALVTDGPAIDGPWIEVKELVGGYMIVRADSLAAASAVARACPGLCGPRSGVEVIEIHGPG